MFGEIDLNDKVRIGGRRDRGDWQDVEPCVFIPISEFTFIS